MGRVFFNNFVQDFVTATILTYERVNMPLMRNHTWKATASILLHYPT